MVLERIGHPLQLRDLPIPEPSEGQVRIQVHACAVCRTDLHVYDGDLEHPNLPLVLGHEIVGTIEEVGPEAEDLSVGQRIGVPWLGWSCGKCSFCTTGRENLCDLAQYTGYQINGGYADYAVADHRYCFPIPEDYSDAEAAPLLCAGLIGYRSLRMAGDANRLGLYGFGAAAHIIAQVAVHQGRDVYAFTKPGDRDGQEFARTLGAVWAGDSEHFPPVLLDAAIIFAPVGPLVPTALRAVTKGGVVVCAGIHMTPIPSFEYELLWEERSIKSVANLTRQDGIDFFEIAPKVPVRTHVQTFPLEDANEALDRLRNGKIQGAPVLRIKT
jgi:propanol-preferring alcohol dehydrogenase